jgi:hypothetical protein
MARAVALLVFLVSSIASAQTLYDRGPPKHRIVHRSLVALRYNALGLVYDGRLGYRHRLYASDSLALRDNYAGAGLGVTLSPAFVRVGPVVELAPASILTLWSSFQLLSLFGTFDQLQSFPDASVVYDDDSLEAGEGYSSLGSELTLGADVQLKVGPIALRARNRLLAADLDLTEGDTVYYDQIYDTILPDNKFTFTTDVDVVYVALANRLVAGVRYTATVPFHDGDHGKSLQRVGPIVSYSFFVRDGARFNAPAVFLLVQWWLDHPHRKDDPGQGVPLIGAGFQFSGDLLPLD